MKTQVHKIPIKLHADPKRVITLPSVYPGLERVKNIYERIVNFSEEEIQAQLSDIFESFGHRHKKLEQIFFKNYNYFDGQYPETLTLSPEQQMLLGASLTKEFSIQSAALFNPSMVPHPDQSGLNQNEKRFIISLRSTGEGHISSIEFRSGVVDNAGNLQLDACTEYALKGDVSNMQEGTDYTLTFPEDSDLSERVIFPQTEVESMGMEDLRLVDFHDEENQTYLGTYTAYNGRAIKSQLLITKDFKEFEVKTLKGKAAQDKGMAIFPEKINGKYANVSRQGGENISIMFSEDLFKWDEVELLMIPKYPFEISQIGNCGSPVRTENGWLLLTHGVGPMRQYTISAALLDLDNPQKVISRLDRPLIVAGEEEREGYVPNVVYSCGGMSFENIFYIPYAMSDSTTGFAWLKMDELLNELEQVKL